MSGFIHYGTSSSFHGTKGKVAQLTQVEGIKHPKPSSSMCPCHHVRLVLTHLLPALLTLSTSHFGRKGIKEHQSLYLVVFWCMILRKMPYIYNFKALPKGHVQFHCLVLSLGNYTVLSFSNLSGSRSLVLSNVCF